MKLSRKPLNGDQAGLAGLSDGIYNKFYARNNFAPVGQKGGPLDKHTFRKVVGSILAREGNNCQISRVHGVDESRVRAIRGALLRAGFREAENPDRVALAVSNSRHPMRELGFADLGKFNEWIKQYKALSPSMSVRDLSEKFGISVSALIGFERGIFTDAERRALHSSRAAMKQMHPDAPQMRVMLGIQDSGGNFYFSTGMIADAFGVSRNVVLSANKYPSIVRNDAQLARVAKRLNHMTKVAYERRFGNAVQMVGRYRGIGRLSSLSEAELAHLKGLVKRAYSRTSTPAYINPGRGYSSVNNLQLRGARSGLIEILFSAKEKGFVVGKDEIRRAVSFPNGVIKDEAGLRKFLYELQDEGLISVRVREISLNPEVVNLLPQTRSSSTNKL